MGELFGVDILAGSKERIFARCRNMLGKGGAIATVNPEILRASVYCDELWRALSRSVNVPDGIGVAKALLLRGEYTDVYPGVELGESLLCEAPVRFGIIGGMPGVAERAAVALAVKHKGATPVLTEDGYNTTEEKACNLINERGAELVFVCMGSPKQEVFIDRIRDSCRTTLFVALGGSVDIYSGDKRRAPHLIRAAKLEWAYRMIAEPERILRAPALFDFCILSLLEPAVYRKIDKT
jgi:N-acetylglucosaminyldiphosphoundecaprenol N-acetyl-beta-D-mannosaminyltransferase